jgi:DNA processing protein
MRDDDELRAWLRLSLCLGPASALRALQALGPPQEIFSASEAALAAALNAPAARKLTTKPEGCDDLATRTLRWLDESRPGSQRDVLTLADPRYPKRLLQLSDPPTLLYVAGQNWIWDDAQPGSWHGESWRAVAMVGSRNASPQGIEHAESFAQALSACGVAVVSGMALGIDAAAHTGALRAHTPTIAFTGTGMDRVYPKRNTELAQQIAAQGVIASEFALGTPALAANFPRRNRLIAALSHATLVVEAAIESGSLITARLASEMGRDVMAIPGSIQSPHAKGCHALIKQGAKLVETTDDVLSELGWSVPQRATAQQLQPDQGGALTENDSTPDALPKPQKAVLDAMGYDASSADEIGARCGIDAGMLAAHLLELELAGRVARLPGNRFQRVGSA